MSYEPTTWTNGDIITAMKLNNIESGVQSVSSSYTPTTWVNGDIITAAKLNNIEQGIANASGGGGGSSDFSTAEVSIINNSESVITMYSPCIVDDEVMQYAINVFPTSSETVDVILFNGASMPDSYILMDEEMVTPSATTGDIEEFDGLFTITGDCTITIS